MDLGLKTGPYTLSTKKPPFFKGGTKLQHYFHISINPGLSRINFLELSILNLTLVYLTLSAIQYQISKPQMV